MEIAGKMQVDVFHRHNLRITAAGRPALDAEAGTERRLADEDDRFLADPIQPVAEADGRRRLAFARRRRIDRRDKDQLAVLLDRLRRDELGADLCLVGLLAAARAISISDLMDGMDVPVPAFRMRESACPRDWDSEISACCE